MAQQKSAKPLQNWPFFALAVVVLIAWYLSENGEHSANLSPQNSTNPSSETNCLVSQQICIQTLNNSQFSAAFESRPVVEEELFIQFKFAREYHLVSAWVEGVNMYMGKTPVLLEPNEHSGEARGVLFLGSCNLSTMNWRLHVKVESTQYGEQTLWFDFTTSLG